MIKHLALQAEAGKKTQLLFLVRQDPDSPTSVLISLDDRNKTEYQIHIQFVLLWFLWETLEKLCSQFSRFYRSLSTFP